MISICIADQTELYECFVALTISQYFENNADFEVLRLQNLPEYYQQCVIELTKLAFTLKDDKMVFTKEDLGKYCPNVASTNKNFQKLGLLKPEAYFSMKKTEECYSYKFLHVMIQEFLKTYYINSLNPSDKFDLLKKRFFLRYADTGVMHIKNSNIDMLAFFEYLIHGVPCEQLKAKIMPKIADLSPLQAFAQLVKICSNDPILANSKLLCYRNSKIKVEKSDASSNSLENFVLYSVLVAANIDWNRVYMSLCCASSRDSQSFEIFVIDKSKEEGVYVKLASHLNENTLLSVVIINSVQVMHTQALA